MYALFALLLQNLWVWVQSTKALKYLIFYTKLDITLKEHWLQWLLLVSALPWQETEHISISMKKRQSVHIFDKNRNYFRFVADFESVVQLIDRKVSLQTKSFEIFVTNAKENECIDLEVSVVCSLRQSI